MGENDEVELDETPTLVPPSKSKIKAEEPSPDSAPTKRIVVPTLRPAKSSTGADET